MSYVSYENLFGGSMYYRLAWEFIRY